MTRIDSHQHFWRYEPSEYAWMTDELAALRRDFLPQDLQPELKQRDFDGCVAVQVRQDLRESEALLALATEFDFIQGVVGWVDLCAAGVAGELARLAQHRKFVGVRHIVQDEPDDEFMLRADFQRGIAELGEHGLTYDLLVFPRQLRAAIGLAEAFPEQPFVLDHCAKPLIRAGEFEPWRSELNTLASFPNVSCKVSGLVTEADWQTWQAADVRPYLDIVFQAFGEDRLMYGSDWPVCRLAGEYASQYELVVAYSEDLTPAARAKLLGHNAQRFYGLENKS
jgi:L-fuconolactonase